MDMQAYLDNKITEISNKHNFIMITNRRSNIGLYIFKDKDTEQTFATIRFNYQCSNASFTFGEDITSGFFYDYTSDCKKEKEYLNDTERYLVKEYNKFILNNTK